MAGCSLYHEKPLRPLVRILAYFGHIRRHLLVWNRDGDRFYVFRGSLVVAWRIDAKEPRAEAERQIGR